MCGQKTILEDAILFQWILVSLWKTYDDDDDDSKSCMFDVNGS